MSVTDLAAVNAQIQQVWSPLFTKELRETLLLGALVNRDYDGDIKKMNDTVKVSEIRAPKGKLRTVGTDADVFETDQLETVQVEIKANKRATAGFEFQDLVEIQSQIQSSDSEIRASLVYSVNKQINDHLYSLLNPQTTPITHVVTGVTNFNAAEVSKLRKLAGQAKWLKNKAWWLLVDPSYHKDLLDAQTLTSSDFVDGKPAVGGEFVNKRFGWNILEDNSEGLIDNVATAGDTEDAALAFHPDFLHLVMQTEAQFKISDLHSQKKFGFVMSVDLIFGAKLSNSGRALHMTVKRA